MNDPILVFCGPTATGKTAAAVDWALEHGGEIVNMDSGQIYRGMDIGTAKPTAAEQKAVRFHLIDIKNPDEVFSAAEFREMALMVIDDILKRDKKPVVVGGTGLYLRTLERGIFDGPARDEAVRLAIRDEIESRGLEALHHELAKVDPEAAASIPFQNRQRLMRALEVYRVTGKPISIWWKEHQESQQKTKRESPYSFKKYALDLSQHLLHQRIGTRVAQMMKEGLVEEVNALRAQWGEDACGLKIIGYKEPLKFLKGEGDLESCTAEIMKNTKAYAKRQKTWFRGDKAVKWVKGWNEIHP